MSVRSYITGLLIAGMAVPAAMAQRPRFQTPPREQRQEQHQQQRDDRRDQQNQQQPSQIDRGRFFRPRPPQDGGPRGDRGNRIGPRDGDWLRQHSNLPPQEQERALENDPTFRQLPQQQQERLRERLQKFNSFSPERREKILHRMDTWERMSPQQRDRARDLFQRFRGVPESRRKTMGLALRTLRNMPPEDRQRLLDSDRFRNSFSPDEIDILRGMTDLNIGPGHGGDEGSPTDGGPQD